MQFDILKIKESLSEERKLQKEESRWNKGNWNEIIHGLI